MVGWSMNSSVAPEINRTGGGNLRRYSMGKASSLNISERDIPHHRRASFGSCHDVCKYGNKHSFETKARDPLLKRALKKSLDGQNSNQVVTLPKREKIALPETKLIASPGSKTCNTDSTDMVKFEVPVNSPSKQSPVEIEVVSESKKLVSKTKTFPYLKNREPKTPKATKQVGFSAKKAEIVPKQALTNFEKKGFPKKLDSLLKPKTSKVKSVISPGSSRNTVVHRNSNSKVGKGARTSEGIEMKVVIYPTVSLDPKSVNAVANLYAKKNKNAQVLSPLKSQNKMRRAQTKDAPNVEVQEKTLYIVNMEIKNKLGESDQSAKNALGLCPKPPSSPKPSSIADFPSLSPHGEVHQDESKHSRKVYASLPESNELDSIKKGEASIGNKKDQSLRTLQSKGKDSSSLNLNFRKGKVVDLHSDSHSPRRQKFRRGRLLADNQKSKDGQRTSFKRAAVGEISKDSTPPSEKVVLRHQGVQGKKDTQVLLNNVIEETASKLVRTRKSKVKALVGAFETVISLQVSKPSLKTVA